MPGLIVERYIAIDNVCAWPNLTAMPDGTLAVAIYNQPVHGHWHGDVEVWASTDDGTIVTVFYSNRIPGHHRYHMGVARWRAE